MIHPRQSGSIVLQMRQRGQAMVEFAIIALLLILLIAGGVELSIAAFNSNRTSEGAKAGANQWVSSLGSGDTSAECILLSSDNPATTDCTNYNPEVDNNLYGLALDTLGAHVGLGDHDNLNNFDRPACNEDGSYTDGLPDDGLVYLYNPLPIDITFCSGSDAFETDAGKLRARRSVLIDGHSATVRQTYPGDPNDLFNGLPAMNRALYSQYQQVCTTPDGIVSCSDGDFLNNAGTGDYRRLLKLPGWLDSEDPHAMSMLPRIVEQNTGGGVEFVLDPDVSPNPKPTFGILCRAKTIPAADESFEPCDSESLPADICWHDDGIESRPLACDVRIESRYRHTFETFIGMTMAEGNSPEMTAISPADSGLFNDIEPGRVGSALQLGGAPKPFRDFYGCYEASSLLGTAATNPFLTSFAVSSCN